MSTGAFTLSEAKAKLAEWKAAETALSTGAQSYSIMGRALTRANLEYVGQRVEYYADMVNRLSRSCGRPRVRQIIPF